MRERIDFLTKHLDKTWRDIPSFWFIIYYFPKKKHYGDDLGLASEVGQYKDT